MDLLRLPGADRVLARHGEVLPQPDQLCGPFAAHVGLHAVLDAVPGTTDLAVAAGTRVWPADVATWRPAGAPLLRTGWDRLPEAPSVDDSGTDAAGVATAVRSLTDVDVVGVPATGLTVTGLAALLVSLLGGAPVGVLANVRTGALDPGAGFDVGHFVVLWGVSADGSLVGVGDTYAELGAAGQPPGCRVVGAESLLAGLAAPPGRGLLLLVDRRDRAALGDLLDGLGVATGEWAT
ncbi:DUF6885 family protein [Nocardioides aurantiacus]|uniref:Uncharacterized protein n=1 Tax=Nocardioides aurantiacus TaxID=86796 RepID=A0A3N2CST4_9ACTN|nr:hypothetical protein [Nocardioides aurantiacus]ROR90613.1 hypothetical protein EDD33_1459 [Nocardioides aurantiacus]